MTWEIAGGPEPVESAPRGERSWTWRLENEDGSETRIVEVVVSDMAQDTTHARAASGSRGRAVIQDVLEWVEPPQRIRCTLVGFVCEGGRQ